MVVVGFTEENHADLVFAPQFFNYEDANPGQDSAGADEEFNFKPAESDLENGVGRNQ